MTIKYGVSFGEQQASQGCIMQAWINDLARLRPGAWMRFQLDWDGVQPSDAGHFDWSWPDKIVTWANAAGINVLFLVMSPPAWANDGNRAHR